MRANGLKPCARGRSTRPVCASKRDLSLKGGRIQNFFFHAPMAKSVQLVGDFTEWLDRPIDLHKGSEGTWWKTLRLETGTHQYRFLVDGQWRDDPECSAFVANSFGSKNSVRRVF
ncbi:MAG: isoamylase early set domain-containing protein [Limisphaerales bacterium]